MIDSELSLIVSRHAPGVCGLFWCNEVPKDEPWRDLPDSTKAAIASDVAFLNRHPHKALPAIVALMDYIDEEARPECKWTRLHGTTPADVIIPRIALVAGLVKLATARFHDGSEGTFVRRA